MQSVNEESQTLLAEMLVSSLNKKFDKFSVDPSYSYAASIYKVSQTLREANEKAYTPKLVSIGPLHHDQPQLQGMEAFKLRFTHKFLTRFGIGLHTIAKFAAKEESFVRRCYEEDKVGLLSKQLAEVIVLDGIFIVELFLETYFIQLREREKIFGIPWMLNDLMHDMLLLENQLPIRIMASLLNFVDLPFVDGGTTTVTIYDLAHKFFEKIGNTRKLPLTSHCYQARHFVEFLLFLHAPTEEHAASQDKRINMQLASKKFEYDRSVGELVNAGVKLRCGEDGCLFGIYFDEEKGVLTIPKLTVNESTETFFRNLVAFEHLGYYGYFSKNITSYVMLMDRFINTSLDVHLLVKHKIIKNDLKQRQKVADLFNNLHKGVLTDVNDFYFAGECEKLDIYCKRKWTARWFRYTMQIRNKWVESLEILGRVYFNNPWSVISVIAASLLLALTIIQTVCSILQVV